jgi:hypothetical protein
MHETTIAIIRSGLKADPSVNATDRARILALLRQKPHPKNHKGETDRVARLIRRAETARRLSCSLRTVDKLSASGVLRKRRLPGRIRASGFLESDVEALIGD